MDKRQKRLYQLAQTILIRQGITTREQIRRIFNKRGVEGVDGIGDVLTKVIEDALEMSDAAWSTLFPKLPLYAPVEGGTTYNPVRVTWYPSSEPDAPMGTVIEGHSLEVPEA